MGIPRSTFERQDGSKVSALAIIVYIKDASFWTMSLYTLRCGCKCRKFQDPLSSASAAFVRVLSKKIQDHYETLGIKKDATQADIKHAFLSRSKQLHPDVNQGDPRKHEKFVELNEAFQTLNKKSSRREYDMTQRHYENVTQHTYPGASHRPGPSSMGHDEWHDWNRPYSKRKEKDEDEFMGVNKKVIRVGLSMFFLIYIWSIVVTRRWNRQHRSNFADVDVDRYKRINEREMVLRRRELYVKALSEDQYSRREHFAKALSEDVSHHADSKSE